MMIKRHLSILVLLPFFICASPLWGQTRPATATGASQPADSAAGPVKALKPRGSAKAKVDPAEAKRKAEMKQKKAQRLQKLQQLQFNRRPSAILAAWPAAEGKPDDKTSDPAVIEKGAKKPKADPFDAIPPIGS